MTKPRRRLRQTDIAERTGVSVSTVSRALANDPSISEALRRQIQQIAKSMGYAGQDINNRRRHARRAVALVPLGRATGGLAGFYEGIVGGMRAGANEMGLDLDVRLFGHGKALPEPVGRMLEEADASCLLLVGIDPSEALSAWVAEKGILMILVNGSDPKMRFSSVAPSNFYGARMATEYLLAAGHRSIAHITYQNRYTIFERTRGFEAAMDAVPDARGMVVGIVDKDPVSEALKAVDGGATALFFMNDLIAVEVLESVVFQRLSLPAGFSAMGFDDLPCASMISPRLSTIAVDRVAIGRAGIRLLVEAMTGDRSIRQLEIGVSLVPGATIHRIARD